MIEQSEANILNAITDYLEANRVLYIRHNPMRVFARRKQISFAPLPPSQRGAPDLIVFLPGGKTVMIEVKSKKGVQSEEQKAWQGLAEKNGFVYRVVRSVDEVTRNLTSVS